MIRKRVATLVVLAGLFVAVSHSSWMAAQSQQDWQVTYSAPGPPGREAGVKTYKIHRPDTTGRVVVELQDEFGLEIGEATYHALSDTQITESIEIAGARLVVEVANHSVRVVANGVEEYNGPFVPQDQASTDDFMQRNGILVRALGDVSSAVKKVLKDDADGGRVLQQAAPIPSILRPVASATLELLSGKPLYAAIVDEPTCGWPDPAYEVMGFSYGTVRSEACTEARNEANLECWNSYCIGCCAWYDEECDCICIWGDALCDCWIWGYYCISPI